MATKKLVLDNTTLYTACWGHSHIQRSLHSMSICADQVDFSDVVFLAPLEELASFTKEIDALNIKIFNLEPMKNYEFAEFFMTKINDFITTDYCINIQPDSTILDASMWTNDFFDYDYIGAPWHIANNYENRVGNGGFSLRSKKLLEVLAKLQYDKHHPNPLYGCAPEDWFFCIKKYSEMKQKGIKFAPPDLAFDFAVEHSSPDIKSYHPDILSTYKSFGFHGTFNQAGMNFINSYGKLSKAGINI